MMMHGLKLVPTKDGYKTTILKGATVSFKELNGRWFAWFPRALEPYAWGDSLDEAVLKTRTKFFKEFNAVSRARRPIEAPKGEAMHSRRNPRRNPRHNPRQLIVAENTRFATINLSAEQSRGFFPIALDFADDASVETKGVTRHGSGSGVVEVSIPVNIYVDKDGSRVARGSVVEGHPSTLIFTIESVEEDVIGLTWRIVADESILEDDE